MPPRLPIFGVSGETCADPDEPRFEVENEVENLYRHSQKMAVLLW
jgi:hypothetical protein